MSQETVYTSRHPKELLLKKIGQAFGDSNAPPPFNELVCKREGNRILVHFRFGVITWPGRGKFTGRAIDAEKGSRVIGGFSSMLVAPLVPTVPFLPAYLVYGDLLQVELLISWGALTLFGLILALTDRRKLAAAIADVLG